MSPTEAVPSAATLPWIDMVGLGLIAFFLLLGVVRGLWWQVIRLVGIVLAVVVARVFSVRLDPMVVEAFPDLSPRLAHGIAWATLFFLTLALATFLGWAGRKLLQAVQLGLADRAGGALAGAVTGAALHLAAVTVILQLAPKEWASSTLSGSYSQEAAVVVIEKWPVVVSHAASADDQVQQILTQGLRSNAAKPEDSSVK